MENIISLESLFHRSKERIKDLGEVFTPDKYVEEMLDMLSKDRKNFWNDERNVFFEPCCGHGNIVLAIYKRRLESIFVKASKEYSNEASLYAVSNSLNTLWAIDIDPENIESCRTRVLHITLQFLKSKLGYDSEYSIIEEHQEFFCHIISAIKWQIYVNETLTSLSCSESYEKQALKTKASKLWACENEHQPVEFHTTWAQFFDECETNDLLPLEYERASKLIESYLDGSRKNVKDFKFAEILYKYNGGNYMEVSA
ncbi:hypothetical protein [Bacteriovorax sp. BAL6_X]|uniref:hypothetical protein n=1 Tax=Bacteriovorax sp. BAL6_X TaxID=1201290 RepID=UPI0012EDE67F|nr:hypothetical protein [Bacteriovorax sp. BAL6_X]